jgi:hypothetical protein
MIKKSATLALSVLFTCLTAVQAESGGVWRLHSTLESDARPLLCKDPGTVDLIVGVLGQAIEARARPDDAKATRLFELAAQLESEICVHPAPEDIVILRCNLAQKSFSNTAITIVKVSALLRSNTSAGEQPFYAWTYATVAGNDGDEASAQGADKKWCTEETAADVALEPTPDLVQRVQQRFYDFGFYIPQIDGRLNPETTQAVIDFQKWAGLPATGQLTKFTVEKIDSTSAPSPWVAVAFDGFGTESMLSGPTRLVAEADAASDLRRKSRSNYRVVSVAYPNCIALATTRYRSRRTTFGEAFTGAGTSEAAAGNNALDYCTRQKGGGSCQIRSALCPAGNEQPPPRYDPENIPANAAPPQFSGGASRFDPTSIPVNARAPERSAEPAAGAPADSANPETSSGANPESKAPTSDDGDKGPNP